MNLKTTLSRSSHKVEKPFAERFSTAIMRTSRRQLH